MEFLPLRHWNTAAVKNAVEEWLRRTRDQEFAINIARHVSVITFKADDKVCVLPISSDAYAMPRVETRRHDALILCNSLLERGN